MTPPAKRQLVALFSASFLGGSELFNLEFLDRARSLGVRIHAVVPGPGELSERLAETADSVTIVPVPVAVARLTRFDARPSVAALTPAATAASQYLLRLRRVVSALEGPVCAFGFRSQLAAAAIVTGTHRRLAWVVHEIVPEGVFGWLWQLAARRADRILTYSRAAAQQPLLQDVEVTVLAISLALERFAALPGPRESPLVLGLVGDLVEIKNHVGAIEVVSRLRAAGHPVTGLLVGRKQQEDGGAYSRRIDDAVHKAGGTVRVISTTPHEMPARMGEMDVLLHLTTVPETFGRVCVEAMAAGRPVIGFAHGAVPEVVGDGGILGPPGDLDKIVASIAALRSRPGAFVNLSATARNGALARYGSREPGSGIGDALSDFAESR